MDISRSPFFYVGDKYKLIKQLLLLFPRTIDRFIEPFCGGGSVFLNINAQDYLINDIDSNLINLHKFLLSYSSREDEFFDLLISEIKKYKLSASFLGCEIPAEIRKKFVKTYYAQYNKSSFIQMRDDYNKNKDNTLLLYLLLIYGFNRMLRFNSDGNYNLPVGNVDFNRNVEKALRKYFHITKEKKLSFFNIDFEEFIAQSEPTSKDFVYLDPPYLITYSEYNKLWNDEDEIRMLNMLDKLDENNIKFAVSNILWHKERYNYIFNKWAQKYNVVNIKSNYISYHDNTSKDSIEVLVKNY